MSTAHTDQPTQPAAPIGGRSRLLPAGLLVLLAALVGVAIWDWRWLLGGLVALLLLGAVYEAVSVRRLGRQRPGELIDVGGYRLHLQTMGSGGPTVVFESGLASTSVYWDTVRSAVAKHTRTCTYDRAGAGWSDPSPHPRTIATITRELHTLLERGGITGPIILVGHSLGGIFVQQYAARYPEQVVGVVLVDSDHEGFELLLGPDEWAWLQTYVAKITKLLRITWRLSHVGLTRLLGPVLLGEPDGLSPEMHQLRLGMYTSRHHLRAALDLAEVYFPVFYPEAQAQPVDLGDKPLVVLEAEGHERHEKHVDLARRSTQSEVRVIKAGHVIHAERPDAVIDAILDVLARV